MIKLFSDKVSSIWGNNSLSTPPDRLMYMDVLRVLACFLVIINHSTLDPVNDTETFFYIAYNFISSASAELFITISGALLLPTKLKMKDFYNKRFSRILFPVLCWSVIILFIDFFIGKNSYLESLMKLLQIPFKPVTGVYWFIYVISGLYLLAPVISPWITSASKKEFLFILLLWILTLFLPVLNLIKPGFYSPLGDYYFLLNHFGGFGGYMLLGFFLRKYPLKIKGRKKLGLISLALISFAGLPGLWSYAYDYASLKMLWNDLSFSSLCLVLFTFIVLQNINFNQKVYLISSKIARYSFGIYLVHVIVVKHFVWMIFKQFRIFSPIIETPLIAFSTFIISLVLVKSISLLPKSKCIVGA